MSDENIFNMWRDRLMQKAIIIKFLQRDMKGVIKANVKLKKENEDLKEKLLRYQNFTAINYN